ncbi:MAG: glycine cleavage system protein GcvH [Pseudomonadota bacterium]|nr:glycine cleavage system protein GcvH [Pseudomonadota bacterium]
MTLKKYTNQHEWVVVNGDIGTVGITDYAQGQLGDVVFVELPQKGTELNAGEEAAVVESVKAAAEVYTPVSGKIIDLNEKLSSFPELVNTNAEDDGWFFTIQLATLEDLDNLMDKTQYNEFILELE